MKMLLSALVLTASMLPQLASAALLPSEEVPQVLFEIQQATNRSNLICTFKDGKTTNQVKAADAFNWRGLDPKRNPNLQIVTTDDNSQPIIVIKNRFFENGQPRVEVTQITTNVTVTEILKITGNLYSETKEIRNVGTIIKPVYEEVHTTKTISSYICK